MTSRDHWVHKRLYTNEMNDNNTSQHGHCVNRIYRQYTHTFIYTQICAHICYKRHFFRCSVNKKIWHLEAIRRAMIFDVDFVINVIKSVTAWIVYIGSIHTHSHTRIIICAHICYKRNFFRCSANKKIWHLEVIRRAMLFDVDFVINVVKTVTVWIVYIGSINTHSHTRRSVRIFAINVTFFAALRIRKYGTWRLFAGRLFAELLCE